MRKQKLGLAGALVASGISFIGCNSTVPQQTVDPTAQIISEYDQVIQNVIADQNISINEIAEKAKDENTKKLNDQKEKDIQVINEAVKLREDFLKKKAEFDKLCENAIFTSANINSTSIPSRNSLLVQNSQSQQPVDKTKEEGASLQAYLSSEERTDRDAYHFCGGGIEIIKPINRNLRWNAGMGTGSSHKDILSPTSLVRDEGNNLEIYGGIRGVLPLGKIELISDVLGKFRFQENTRTISDIYGDNTTKDTTSIPGIGASLGLKIGPFFIKREFNQYFGGESQHEGLATRSWKAGVGFVWK